MTDGAGLGRGLRRNGDQDQDGRDDQDREDQHEARGPSGRDPPPSWGRGGRRRTTPRRQGLRLRRAGSELRCRPCHKAGERRARGRRCGRRGRRAAGPELVRGHDGRDDSRDRGDRSGASRPGRRNRFRERLRCRLGGRAGRRQPSRLGRGTRGARLGRRTLRRRRQGHRRLGRRSIPPIRARGLGERPDGDVHRDRSCPGRRCRVPRATGRGRDRIARGDGGARRPRHDRDGPRRPSELGRCRQEGADLVVGHVGRRVGEGRRADDGDRAARVRRPQIPDDRDLTGRQQGRHGRRVGRAAGGARPQRCGSDGGRCALPLRRPVSTGRGIRRTVRGLRILRGVVHTGSTFWDRALRDARRREVGAKVTVGRVLGVSTDGSRRVPYTSRDSPRPSLEGRGAVSAPVQRARSGPPGHERRRRRPVLAAGARGRARLSAGWCGAACASSSRVDAVLLHPVAFQRCPAPPFGDEVGGVFVDPDLPLVTRVDQVVVERCTTRGRCRCRFVRCPVSTTRCDAPPSTQPGPCSPGTRSHHRGRRGRGVAPG